jgi:hypothetical protein
MKGRPEFLLLLLLLIGCIDVDTNSGEGLLLRLYKQRIPNSNLVIYKFDYYGSFVTNSDYTGLTILDSSIRFARDKIERLPGYYFAAKPRPDVLKMISMGYITGLETERDTLLTPDRQYSKRVNGVQVDVKEYKPTYGTSLLTGFMAYQFDSFKETDDSLTFFNVVKMGGGPEFSSPVSFVKGNIEIVDSTDNKINYIDIDQVVIQRGKIYKSTWPNEIIFNQPVVGIATYRFYPKTGAKTLLLSDYGIFKRIK